MVGGFSWSVAANKRSWFAQGAPLARANRARRSPGSAWFMCVLSVLVLLLLLSVVLNGRGLSCGFNRYVDDLGFVVF